MDRLAHEMRVHVRRHPGRHDPVHRREALALQLGRTRRRLSRCPFEFRQEAGHKIGGAASSSHVGQAALGEEEYPPRIRKRSTVIEFPAQGREQTQFLLRTWSTISRGERRARCIDITP